MKKIIFAIVLVSGLVYAQHENVWAPSDSLPVDPAVRTGELDNGLCYYVRQNKKPQDRAELRLVVNAGSVLENSSIWLLTERATLSGRNWWITSSRSG